MLSGSSNEKLYLVQVVYGGGVREHVADTECADFRAALGVANRVRRWLSEGWGVDLPDGALDLRGELERAGFDPRGAAVQVVRLDPRGPGRWDLRGAVLCEVTDPPATDGDDDQDDDDTPLVLPGVPAVRVRQQEGR